MKNKKLMFSTLIWIAIVAIFISTYGIINTMVSLKYETDENHDCISMISGSNLCQSIANLKIALVFSFIFLFSCLFFQNKLLKNEKSIEN